jgi:hypothetical protein
MKKHLTILVIILLSLGLGLGLGVGRALAQGGSEQEIKFSSYVDLPIQGRLLSSSGVPVNTTVTMTLRLYSAASGGTLYCEDSHPVAVTDGLYTTTMNCLRQDFDGKDLYLGVTVGTDPEMTPRQKLLPVPYAVTFLPGAFVKDETGSGPILALVGKNSGIPGAFYVMNNNTAGIATWLDTSSTDSTLVVRNLGSGPLIKGFGGNGGEYEFMVNNDGSIESLGDTTIFIAGNEAFMDPAISSSYFTVTNEIQGLRIDDNMDGANFVLFLQLSLPSMLYGHPVDIEEITIYYKVSDSNTYFNRVSLGLMPPPPTTTETIIVDYSGGPFNSTTYSSFTIPMADYNLSENHGLLHMRLYGWTNIFSSYVNLYGVRIRLGHTYIEP